MTSHLPKYGGGLASHSNNMRWRPASLLPQKYSHPATCQRAGRCRRAGNGGVPGRRNTGGAGAGGAPGARMAPQRAGRAGGGVLQGHPPRTRPVGHPRYATDIVARSVTGSTVWQPADSAGQRAAACTENGQHAQRHGNRSLAR